MIRGIVTHARGLVDIRPLLAKIQQIGVASILRQFWRVMPLEMTRMITMDKDLKMMIQPPAGFLETTGGRGAG